MMVILHAPSVSEAGTQLMALENETERLSVCRKSWAASLRLRFQSECRLLRE